jgi:hypothetical protein
MAKRKSKSISFDAMVKFFMSNYQIPTKRDVERLNARLDRIEKLLINVNTTRSSRRSSTSRSNVKSSGSTASDTVLEAIGKNQDGIGFAEIQRQTGFDDKKLRNIIFRLHKMNRIKRISRGIYTIT